MKRWLLAPLVVALGIPASAGDKPVALNPSDFLACGTLRDLPTKDRDELTGKLTRKYQGKEVRVAGVYSQFFEDDNRLKYGYYLTIRVKVERGELPPAHRPVAVRVYFLRNQAELRGMKLDAYLLTVKGTGLIDLTNGFLPNTLILENAELIEVKEVR